MTNEEIDIRLKNLIFELPKHFERIYEKAGTLESPPHFRSRTDIELELLNMTMVGVLSMLGEIAKRLPEGSGNKTEGTGIEPGSITEYRI